MRLQPPEHQLCFAKTPILDFRSTNSQGLQSCSVVRLQPPEHQLCFAKTPILDFRSTNSQGLQSCSVLRLQPLGLQPNLGIHWYAATLCSAEVLSLLLSCLCCFRCLYSHRCFCSLFCLYCFYCSGPSPHQQHRSPLLLLFLCIPCLCPFVSAYTTS